jgi:pimeloyl-ACP methyl ester carboxylesterase
MELVDTKRHTRRFWSLMTLFAVTALAGCGGDDGATGSTVETSAADSGQDGEGTSLTPQPASGGDAIGVVCGQEQIAGYSQVPCEEMSFDIEIPDVCPEVGCGLIVDVHGYTGSGTIAEQHTGMQSLGNDAGYVVVQPNNPEQSWDYLVDADRIRSFMGQLIDGLALDRDRIHFGGFSQGGTMTWRFICDHPDLIASAAPAGAGATYPEDYPVPAISCDFDTEGHPAHEVDILYVHGRSDTDVPFETALEQRDLVVSAWEMSETDVLIDEPDYRWTRWMSAQRTEFEFLEHDWQGGFLGGHCYPGREGKVGCGADTPVAYGQAALQFYIDHPKNE